MTGEHLRAEARRVVTGVDAQGRSGIVVDGLTTAKIATPGFTVLDIWKITNLPTTKADGDRLTAEVELAPPTNGLVYRLNVFPPDSEWDFAGGYSDSMEAIGAGDSMVDDTGTPEEIPGLHETDTIDILTVISGEIYAVLETGETLLRPGDSIVQRGTKHTWRNRGDVPCTLAVLLLPAPS